MVAVRVFAEGGPMDPDDDPKSLGLRLQRAFGIALAAAAPGLVVNIEACGSRDRARDRFTEALSASDWASLSLGDHGQTLDPYPILLVDSERPVTKADPWLHLAEKPDEWWQPPRSTPEQAHLMVETMEAWFLVNRAQVQAYFGAGYRASKLPNTPAASMTKGTLDVQFRAATRKSALGTYDKGLHSPNLLEGVDLAGEVGPACAWAQRLVNHLQLLAATP